jgi:ParB family chromosome partitioning protein
MADKTQNVICAVEPFEERIDTLFRELELAIKWQRPSILLAVYGSEYVHVDARAALENRLTDLGQKVLHFQITNEENSDISLLISGVADLSRTVFFVDGLRQGFRNDGFNAYMALNIYRDYFIDNRIRVVFWLTEGEAMDLAHYAPDYWAFRHRVIEFVESPKPEQMLLGALESAWQGVESHADAFDDTDAKISLHESLLTDLPKGNEATAIRADLLLTLGMLHWRKSDQEKAIRFLRAALDVAMKMQDKWLEAVCFNAIALVETDLGRLDEAIEAYKQAVDLAPEHMFPWNNLGNLYSKLHRNDEALEAFRRAIEHKPDDAVSWNGLGNVCFELGRSEDAIIAYRKAIELVPGFAPPWNGLGNVYVSMGRVEEAIAAYQKAIDLDKRLINPWVNLGEIYRSQKRNDQAVKAYTAAVGIDPGNPHVWNGLGNAYFNVANYQEATDAYNRALELINGNTDNAISLNRYGDVHGQPNDYDAAIAAYQKMNGPGLDGGLPQNEGSAPGVLKDEAEDVVVAEKVVETDTIMPPQESDALGLEQTVSDDHPDEKDIEADPANTHLWNELGNIYFNAGSYDEAMKAYRKAIEFNPGLGLSYGNLALTYVRQGKYAEAIPLYQKSIESAGSSKDKAISWNRLGDAYRRLKDYDDAIAAYRMADELDPGDALGENDLREVSVAQIDPNPRQPRTKFEVEELVKSVREHGIIQPLIVAPSEAAGRYELIAGGRRLEAARRAGLERVPVIVRQASDQQRLELALIENVQRADLNPLELAEAYRQLAEEFELSHEEIAVRVGKSRVAVTNTLRLLKLTEEVKEALIGGRISEGHARALLGLGAPQMQMAALGHILKNELNVRQAEELARELVDKRAVSEPVVEERKSVNQVADSRVVAASRGADESDAYNASLMTRARFILLSDRYAEQKSHLFSYRNGG